MRIIFFLYALVIISLALARPDLVTGRACNNSPQLCSLPYDEVTYLGAHDSPFVRDASSGYLSFGNQSFNTTVQLDAGVRLLTAQVHVVENAQTKAQELHLCHSVCALFDVGLLSNWLWEIRTWLDANPNDVVTLLLINMSGVHALELVAEYSRADLAYYGYNPPQIDRAPLPSSEFNKTWPTLGKMIDKGQRLVSFVNSFEPDKANAPYLLNEFDFVWENAYDVTDPAKFDCMPDRPSNRGTIQEQQDSGRLFLMNHFLYWKQGFVIDTPDIRKVAETNSWDRRGGLGTHMRLCSSELLRQPTFVLVDFFNAGLAMDVIDDFKGVQKPVGRKLVTNETTDSESARKTMGNVGIAEQASTMALAVAVAMAVIFDLKQVERLITLIP
ncbi:hypothetical protein T440DRAFT_441500 [Plenodomus tracheiphilus IPT5]|uniref:PLC-like phosphodiesterase n=1 Tax=Plenodomus tracheiphilus IPT5 TaxID=1408161 RepID=A0A6A7BK38_9PLEO|nr:hypothetical protein T440DRAFT_441500 [Plenodomus tracheiphilus IPT5]